MLATHFMCKTDALWAENFFIKDYKTDIFKKKWEVVVLTKSDSKLKRSNSIHKNGKN